MTDIYGRVMYLGTGHKVTAQEIFDGPPKLVEMIS